MSGQAWRGPGAVVLLLATVRGLAAGGPEAAPPPRLVRPVPADWPAAELTAAVGGVAGSPAVVLAWERVEYGGVFAAEDRCLLVVHRAALGGGPIHAAAVLVRRPNFPRSRWQVAASGEYPAAPTDAELTALLGAAGWHSDLVPGELTLRIGGAPPSRVRYRPRILDGGVVGGGWREGLGRAPATELFPELRVPLPTRE